KLALRDNTAIQTASASDIRATYRSIFRYVDPVSPDIARIPNTRWNRSDWGLTLRAVSFDNKNEI
ncbi:MAG: hypothetical protein ACKO96_34920, partial [Flammeovirgaceae bacterium]